MSPSARKYLRVGAILCAIGASSAALITCVNVFTAPAIAAHEAEKKEAGLKVVYEATDHYDADVAVDGEYVSAYNVCYDADNNELGYVFTASGSSGVVKTTKILVGVSGEAVSPVLGKVYFIANGATGAYGIKVENNYVDPYNGDPSEATLDNVTCGATVAATLIRSMVKEAESSYVSAKGGA
ncbi:MAG: hypothetical protein LKK13_05110 [Bacilli bacterium]|jgi:Na+-translocating ferredoxin:NAD+ oxidoreductase RnfG subunit|nr:hypothetical protein [Bacilli bacterium]